MTSVLHLAVYMSNEMETPDISKLDEACNATTKLCDTFVDLVQDVDKKDVNELVEMSKQLIAKACVLADYELDARGLPTGPSPPSAP